MAWKKIRHLYLWRRIALWRSVNFEYLADLADVLVGEEKIKEKQFSKAWAPGAEIAGGQN